MLKKLSAYLVACLMMVSMVPVTAEAQSKKELQEAINQLNNHVNTLYGIADEREKEERRILADMATQIGTIERQMRALTGRIEQMEYQQKQLTKRLDLIVSDTEMRFDELERAKVAVEEKPAENLTPVVTEPETVPESVDIALPDGSAASRYSWAYGFVRENKLDEAKDALKLVIEAHPKDAVAANAHYWLGRVHMLQKKPALAAQQFLTVFDSFPEHNKVPDSLVELGTSLTMLDENEQACQAYLELQRNHPTAKARLLKRAEEAINQLGCAS